MRFDATKVLLDPYGYGVVVPKGYSGRLPSRRRQYGDGTKSVVVTCRRTIGKVMRC
jgi:hypothetical protein